MLNNLVSMFVHKKFPNNFIKFLLTLLLTQHTITIEVAKPTKIALIEVAKPTKIALIEVAKPTKIALMVTSR